MSVKALQRYETRPLQSWRRCKELRVNHYKEFITAKEQGKLIVAGSGGGAQHLICGLGNARFLAGEPYGATVGGDPQVSQEYMEACESRGFARDLDSYLRNYLGSMYLNKYYFGGPFPRPDFILSTHFCDTHFKWYQIEAEHFGIPKFGIDIPIAAELEDRVPSRIQFVAEQMLDAIVWMEKVTGQRYDDGLLIDAIYRQNETESLWGQICLLNQAIPAPLDQRALFVLYFPGFQLFYLPDTPDLYREIRDEVADRVKASIAAWPYERARLLHDSQPPWHWMKVFRIPEQYGAVSVGSQYAFCGGCTYDEDENGLWHAPKTLKEKGVQLKSREDAVNYLATKMIDRTMMSMFCAIPGPKNKQMVQMVEQWHCDGVLIHLNRGCEGVAQLNLENRLALMEAGIPTATFEGNMADFREFDEAQTIDRIESFMESLGLTKLDI